MQLQPVILSGGSGTRLWPLSREFYPKQFLPLGGHDTLLQATLQRLDGLQTEHPHRGIALAAPLVVCNEAHRFLVAEQFRSLRGQPGGILLEPMGRNTAPALTLAAHYAGQGGHDPILLVMPADHLVQDEVAFRRAIACACAKALAGGVVTLGVVPQRPETGYGYLERGLEEPSSTPDGMAMFQLDRFVEKPDQPTAQGYLESGRFYWNAGLFILRASVWLRLITHFRPEIARACERAWQEGTQEGLFWCANRDAFAGCPADSIDYAVMEPLTTADRAVSTGDAAYVLPLDAGWSDVGAWSALWEIRDKDAQGNVVEGDVFVHAATDNLLISQHRLVAAVGVRDLVVVETPDAVLVMDKAQAQEVKAVIQYLQREGRPESRTHRCVHRPWGNFEPIDQGPRYQVKRLTVNPGEALSLQMHHHRAEHWVVVSGTAQVTCEDRVFLLAENQSTYIPIGARHRLENPGVIPLEIIEVQSGAYLGEDDIKRFHDHYQRPTQTAAAPAGGEQQDAKAK
ncbi:MAG: mannose-1-phosphate guanylyltransferase/mannose-6-phosphate isomerase [Pseudomonadota bacterium]